LIESCQKYPGTRWLMGRAKLKTLKETTLATFFETCSDLGIVDQWEYKEQKGLIQWSNGSEIILKDLFLYPSDPNFDELGSLEITGAFIDECNQVVFKAWQIVKSRIRYKLKEFGLIPKILGTCNPAKNWVYKLFYIPSKTGTIADYRRFIQALPKDNPHLPKEYIENLLQLDEASKRRLHDGDWEYDDDKSALIGYKSIINYWNGQQVQPEGDHYLTIDVARKGKDKTIFRIWHGWVCIKRVSMAKSLITEIVAKAQEIQSEYGILNINTVADEDGVGGGVVDYLGCEGFVNNSRPIYAENYDNLKSQCSIIMAKRINRGEVVELCNDQQVIDDTTEEMEQIKLKDIDKDGKLSIIAKDKIKDQIGRSPDDWDSIMMREYFELVTTSFFIG